MQADEYVRQTDGRNWRAIDAWSYGVCVGEALMAGVWPSVASCLANDGRPFERAAVEAAESTASLNVKRLFELYRRCTVKQPEQRPLLKDAARELVQLALER
jgi:hypothetical protein